MNRDEKSDRNENGRGDGAMRTPGARIADGQVARLRKGELWPLQTRAGELEVISGSVWITAEGDGSDFVLEPGRVFDLHGKRAVLIEALSDALLAFSHAERARPDRRPTWKPPGRPTLEQRCG